MMRAMRSWWWMVAPFCLACGATEPPAVKPTPEPTPTPTPAPTPTPTVVTTAPAVEAPDAAPDGPKVDNPGWVEVGDVTNAKLVAGFYFVDGNVLEAPCKACVPPPACKPGGNCPKAEACALCDPTLRIEDGGKNAGFEFDDRLKVPKFRAKERVRVVFEKRGSRQLFVRQSKPCSPSECLETDPPMKLDPPAKGKAVRRDGARCYAKGECPPNAKCDPDRETRVRCP